MTDSTATRSEPSMEDILASIRRIMDDDASAAPAPSAAADAGAPQSGAVAAAQALAEDEPIFPERGGLLWRRVAGRPLSEEDEALEEVAREAGDDPMELDQLLEEAAAAPAAPFRRAAPSRVSAPSGPAAGGDEVLDLTRPYAPAPDAVADDDADDAMVLDAEAEDYESVLRPRSGFDAPTGEAAEAETRERALDDRFYEAPPEVEGDYAAALGTDAVGGPAADELETVGGMVREALERGEGSDVPLVSRSTEEEAGRALATLVDSQTPRRVYSQLRITDDADAPTVEAVVRDMLRPMLREWLDDNLRGVVEGMVAREVERIGARSRRFVRPLPDGSEEG